MQHFSSLVKLIFKNPDIGINNPSCVLYNAVYYIELTDRVVNQ